MQVLVNKHVPFWEMGTTAHHPPLNCSYPFPSWKCCCNRSSRWRCADRPGGVELSLVASNCGVNKRGGPRSRRNVKNSAERVVWTMHVVFQFWHFCPCAVHLHKLKPPRAIRSNPATHMISEPRFSSSSLVVCRSYYYYLAIYMDSCTLHLVD
jgi:hypothetical protein